jgi:hypothetical protein
VCAQLLLTHARQIREVVDVAMQALFGEKVPSTDANESDVRVCARARAR